MDKDSHDQLNTYPLDEVSIKEEDDDTGEYDSHETIREEHIDLLPCSITHVKIEYDGEQNIDPKLLMSPIVYTKKLDNMKVLHASYCGQSTKTILNKIVEESRPHFKQISNNQNINSSPSIQASFRWVKLRVGQLKRKCVSENEVIPQECKYKISPNDEDKETKQKINDPANLINAELLKMCKPCSIPMERVDGKVSNSFRKHSSFVNSDNYLRLIIADKSINETDVYCVQGNVNTEHYRFKGVNDEQLMSYEKLFGVKKIDVCCWYQRENVVVTLNNLDFPDNLKKIIKRPHFCPYDRCTCCCRFYKPLKIPNDKADCSEKVPEYKSVQSVLPEDMEIQNLEQELTETYHQMKYNSNSNEYRYNWLQDLLSENSCNTLVNKSLNYNPPKENTKKSFSETTPAKSLRVNVQFKTKETEHFELNQHGILEMHAKLAPNSKFGKVLSYSTRCEDYRFCCWKRRASVIKLNFTLDDSRADLRRFLNAQHTCAPEKCKCCCFRDCTSAKLHLGDITVPERITSTHTVNVIKITKNAPRIKSEVKHPMTSEAPHILPVLPYTIPIHIDDNEPQSTPVLSEEVDDCMIVDVVPSPTTKNQGATTLKDSNSIQDTIIPSQPLPNPGSPKIPISANVNNQTLAVDSMITTILDRFRNVRLTLNEAGEVAASLDTPVNSLNTAELKVLANILAHAQRQVQVIGLANSSKSAGPANVQGTIANNLPFAQSAAAPVSPVLENTMITQVQQTTQPNISQTTLPNTNNSKTNNQKLNPKPRQTGRQNIFQNFAQLLNKKNAKALQSFTAFIENKNITKTQNTSKQENNAQKLDEPVIPVISNVFSLKDTINTNAKANEINSALKSWSDETTQNTPTILIAPLETPSLKRKSEENAASSASKIRVVDPAKLGITKSFDEPVKENEIIKRRLHLSSGGFLTSNNFLSGATVVPAGNTLAVNSQNQAKLFYLGKSQNVLHTGGTIVGTTMNSNDNTQMTTLNSTNVTATQTAPDTYRIQYFGDSVQLVPVAIVGNNTIVAPQNKPQFTSQHVVMP